MELELLILFASLVGILGFFEEAEDNSSNKRYDDDPDGRGTSDPGADDGSVVGTTANDILFGWTISGDATTDTTFPNDFIDGDDGDDMLYGGSGTDTLLGGDGDDVLDGGGDSDTLIGGDGNDQFVIAAGAGDDSIVDLSIGDRVQLTGLSSAPTLTDDGTDSRILDGTGREVQLMGVISSELSLSSPDENGDYFVDRILVLGRPATIDGVTDFANATIGGTKTGAVTEDAAATLDTTGTLTVTDPNPGEAVFVAQSDTTGTYGSFNLATDGTWNFSADNSQAAVQALAVGQTVTDVFTATTPDGTTQGVTITLSGANDAPAAVADATSVGEDATIAINVVANDIDSDTGTVLSIASFDTTDTIGAVTLTSATSFIYDPNGKFDYLNTGETATDTFTYTVDDGAGGTALATVTLTMNGDSDVISAIALSDVANGDGGFVIKGISASDYAGWDVSDAGDVNGDGTNDIIISAPYDDPNGSRSGAAFVVFGKAGPTPVELSNVEAGVGGFVTNGVSADDMLGRSVSSAGDVNGDGLDDLIIGAQYDDPNGSASGAAFVVFGKADSTAVELSNVEAGTGGFVINGDTSYDLLGVSVSAAGDVNGDGLDDLIVGAKDDQPTGSTSNGSAFVVFGKADGTAVDASAIKAGTGGFAISGVDDFDGAGFRVSGAGDVNGDGLDDVIVTAPLDDPNGASSGASFVVFGKADGTTVDLADVEAGTGGFVINGASAGDQLGYAVAAAGDVNGDGLDDIIVTADNADPNGSSSGAGYVVFGKADGNAVEASDINAGFGGFAINGITAGDFLGYAVDGAGDVNGDGLDDIIIQAGNAVPDGEVYVIFGKTDTATVELSDIVATGLGGLVMNGAAGDAIFAVGGGGDFNDDGLADLIIGSSGNDLSASNAGAAYVVYGRAQ